MKKLVIFMMAISISLLLEAAPAPARKSLFQITGKAINKRIVEPIKTQYNKNTKRIDLQDYSNQSSINYKPSAGQYSTDAIKTYNQNPLDKARIAVPRFNNAAYHLRNAGSAVVAPFQVAGRGIASAGRGVANASQKVGSGIASGVKNAIETAKTAYNSVKNNIKDLQQSYQIKKNARLLSKEMETSKPLNTSIKTDKYLLENLSKDLDNPQYNYGFNKDQKEEIMNFAQDSFKSSPEKFRPLLMEKILEVATRQT